MTNSTGEWKNTFDSHQFVFVSGFGWWWKVFRHHSPCMDGDEEPLTTIKKSVPWIWMVAKGFPHHLFGGWLRKIFHCHPNPETATNWCGSLASQWKVHKFIGRKGCIFCNANCNYLQFLFSIRKSVAKYLRWIVRTWIIRSSWDSISCGNRS